MESEVNVRMTNVATIIGKGCDRRTAVFLPLLFAMMFLAAGMASAQTQQMGSKENSLLDTIPEEAKAVFERYVQKKDTATMAIIEKHRRDKFIKRFSFHTNAVDWATLVPNVGVEFDLKGTPRNNWSISVFGKFNGKSKHGKLVYNVNAVRVEGRKYWRTGKYGSNNNYYDDFEKLYSKKSSPYFNIDTLVGRSYYVDTLGRVAKAKGVKMQSIRATYDMTQEQKDSLDFAEDSLGIKNSRFRKWYYNTYHKLRRNVTSGRTLENPRNWRAYYLGVWAGMDNWSISLTGKGKQGQGVGAGLVAGYTLPLFPQKFPREGSLDLDLGLAVGWKAVKYDAYTYEEQTQHYVYDRANSQLSWKIVPYPIVQDIHVSLVWRFRGIKSKVDRSLIDDYNKKWVARYKERENNASIKYDKVMRQRQDILEKLRERYLVMADSTGIWDSFHKRRLEAARRINPDTTFVGNDMNLYLKIFEGLNSQSAIDKHLKAKKEEAERKAKEQAEQAKNQAKEEARQAKNAAKRLADSLEVAHKDSVRMAKKQKSADMEAALTDTTGVDSVQVLQNDSVMTVPEPIEQTVPADTVPDVPEDSILVQPVDSVPVTVPVDDVPENCDGEESKEEEKSETEDDKENEDADTACTVLSRKRSNIAPDADVLLLS